MISFRISSVFRAVFPLGQIDNGQGVLQRGNVFPLFLLALCGLLSALPAAAQIPKEIRVCSSMEDGQGRPRFAFFRNADGQTAREVTGYSAEFVRQILTSRQQVTIDLIPWKRCLEQAEAGNYAIVLDANKTPERQKRYRVSLPYYTQKKIYLYAKNKTYGNLQSIAELRRLRVCGQLGKDYSGWGLMGIEVDTASRTLEQGLLKIKLGRCDVVLARPEVIDFYRPAPGADGVALEDFAWRELPQVPAAPSVMLISRNVPYSAALAALIDSGIEQMQRDGRKKALEEKFLNK